MSWSQLLDYIAPPYQFLDLTPGAGNLLGQFEWEMRSALHGGAFLRNTGPSPRDAIESFLSQILQAHPPKKYYLTTAACLGILRRAEERGKPLPKALDIALRIQAGLIGSTNGRGKKNLSDEPVAFAQNQRDEVRDLHDLAGALGAKAVITTATDVNGKFAVDAWAAQNGCAIEDFALAKRFAAEILEHELPLCSEFPVCPPLPGGVVAAAEGPFGVYIGCRTESPFGVTLRLIPRKLRVGLGCRRGTEQAAIETAVRQVFWENRLALAAISGVLMVIEIPLFFAPSFYKLDFSELPVLICAFYLGPVSGVVCEFLKVLIKLLLKGTSTAFVGDLANFLVGCSFVLPAAIVYQKTLSKKGAVVSLAVGTAVMTVFGSFFNAWFLIPRFAVMYGMPLEAIVSMGTQINGAITNLSTLVLFAVVPFNLLKGVLVSLLTFFLYKRVEKLFFRKKHTA